jgi:hypothetical protein
LAALALGGLVLPALAFADVSPSDGVRLGKSEAHLYYTGTGELSADLLAGDEPFSGWNTVIGEGPSGGAADDMLVVATLVSDGPEPDRDAMFLGEKLDVWVTDAKGKTLGRRVIDGLLVPARGTLRAPLWLNNVTCAGELTVHAKFRAEKSAQTLRLDCGE